MCALYRVCATMQDCGGGSVHAPHVHTHMHTLIRALKSLCHLGSSLRLIGFGEPFDHFSFSKATSEASMSAWARDGAALRGSRASGTVVRSARPTLVAMLSDGK